MTELPGSAWLDSALSLPEMLQEAPVEAAWKEAGQIRHVFTHFTLQLRVMVARLADFAALHNQPGFACPPERVAHQALPSVMQKCLTLAGVASVD